MKRLARGGVSQILLGSLIGQGLLLAVSPLLTRLYSPTDFAALAAFTGVAAVLGALITLSWERAVVIPRSESQAAGLVVIGIGTSLVLSAVLAVVMFFGGDALDRLFSTNVFGPLWWLLPLTTASMGLYAVLSSLLVRKKAYGRIALRNGVLGAAQAVSTISLGFGGFGVVGLVSGSAVGRLAATIGIAPGLWRGARTKNSRRRLAVLAVRFRRFPLVATWSRAFNVLGLQLPPLLIVAIYGSWEAGLYALTLRVLAAPIGIVTDAVSQYFEGVFGERVRSRSGGLRGLILSLTGRLAAVAVVPAIIVMFFAPQIFETVFGEQWRVAGEFAQIVVWFYAAQLVVSPITRALLVLEKQFQQLVWDIARATTAAIAVFAPLAFGGSLRDALLLLTVTQIILYAVVFIMCMRAAGRAERRALLD